MKIPKIVHFVWVGPNKPNEFIQKCIDSWVKFLPDFEIRIWNEANLPVHIPYLKNALEKKKWANISNFARLYSINEFGGIYFDSDFELIKSIPNEMLDVDSFFSFQDDGIEVNNAIMGARKGHYFVKLLLDQLIKNFDGAEEAHLSSPRLTTIELNKIGLKFNTSNISVINDIVIYPKEYFHPFPYDGQLLYSDIKPNTIGIHHWTKTWIIDEKINQYREQIIKLYSIKGIAIILHQLIKKRIKFFINMFNKGLFTS
jgi:mannosyltransferase OCH1-like enzyme